MTEKILVSNFEQVKQSPEVSCLTHTSIELGRVAMEFARIERMPRYADGRRETDTEHSFMLALTAPELAQALELDLQPGLLSQFAIVHDLVELKTDDVATFLLTDADLCKKEDVEKMALQQLLKELPPYTAYLLARYEAQEEPEARFVRFVDKLLPIVVDILGNGQRVMQEDYGIHTTEELARAHSSVHKRLDAKFGTEFPAISAIHTDLIRTAERLLQFA